MKARGSVAERSRTVFVLSGDPVIVGVVRLSVRTTHTLERVVTGTLEEIAEHLTEGSAVVVVDLDGPDHFAALKTLSDAHDDARLIGLADQVDGKRALEAIRLGVYALIRKPDGLHDLGEVLERVAAGERVLPPDFQRSAVSELGRFARKTRTASAVAASITPREREILVLLADGLTMHQIGRRLGISPRTVETHVAKLYRKLGVRTRLQGVARAAALGLVDLD